MGILDRVVRSDEIMIYQEAAYVLSNVPTLAAREILGRELDNAKDPKRKDTLDHAYADLAKQLAGAQFCQ